MKKNLLALAFTVMLASTSVFADGETGHGNRQDPPPPPPAGRTSSTSTQPDSSNVMFMQVLNAILAVITKA